MIEVIQHRIRILPFKATPNEGEIARLAVQNYGFVLKDHPFGTPTRYSFSEFAAKIEQQYGATNPRNAEVVQVLQTIHQRNATLH